MPPYCTTLAMPRFRMAQIVSDLGFDPEFCLIVDRAADLPYGHYYLMTEEHESAKPPILVESGQGRQVLLETASGLVQQLGVKVVRGAIYVPGECAGAVRAAVGGAA